MLETPRSVVIGTRGSPLALVQTRMVRDALARHWPELEIRIERIVTTGDRVQDRPLIEVGGKATFVTEIELALREGRIAIAVHSGKDLPSELPNDMHVAAWLPRADARDALVSRAGATLHELRPGARVGTSSPRRACQLRSLRPDLDVRDVRGNVETRLSRLYGGHYDALVLAAAGLSRLGLLHVATQLIPTDVMLPCAAQGAVAVEIRAGDDATAALLAPLDHGPTAIAVAAERAFLAAIGGGCDWPLAAHATLEGDHGESLAISAMAGAADGRTAFAHARGPASDPLSLGTELAERLLAAGGAALLDGSAGSRAEAAMPALELASRRSRTDYEMSAG